MKKTISIVVPAASLLVSAALFVCEKPNVFENPVDKEGSNYLYGRHYDSDDEQHCTSVNDYGVALLFTDDSACNEYVAPDTATPVITLQGNNPAEFEVGQTYTDGGVTVSIGELDSIVVKGTNSGNNYRQELKTTPVVASAIATPSNAAAGFTYTVTYYASYNGRAAAQVFRKVKAAPSPPSGGKFSETVGVYKFDMMLVAGGTFKMGCADEQSDCYYDERPVHDVTLSSFYIGEYEVTQGLWKAVMGSNSNPSSFTGNDELPVDSVSWNQVKVFIDKLNSKTGRTYKLPTEAEWEFAARGGINSEGYKFSGGDGIDSVAWYWSNSGSKTHEVGGKKPNELGIYDMSGNVWEWVSDWYNLEYYAFFPSDTPSSNPSGPSEGIRRVIRGCSWYNNEKSCRVSLRAPNEPVMSNNNVGFRLALSPR